jgi:hypothetical protein
MKYIIKKLMIVFTITILATASFAITVEQGSLKSFILGQEPNAAYDNWLSHTVEGLATADGYNDYIPDTLDTQMNGFGNFTFIASDTAESFKEVWIDIFQSFYDNPTATQDILDAENINYEVVLFNDIPSGRPYIMLRELLDSTYVDPGLNPSSIDDVVGSFNYGWGLFIINPQALLPAVMIQAVHPNDDYISVPLAVELFLDSQAGALAIHGTGREVKWLNGYSFNNGRSLSDPSRNKNLPFQFFVDFFVDRVRREGLRDLSLNIHSYDTGSHPNVNPIQVSCGSADGIAHRPSIDISSSYLDWANFTPSVPVPGGSIYGTQEAVEIQDYFCFWRAYGLVHQASGNNMSTNLDLIGHPTNHAMLTSAVGMNPHESHDRFLHVEFDELPQEMQDIDIDEEEFYRGDSPPTERNYQKLFQYYGPALTSLKEYLYNDYLIADTIAPATPETLIATLVSDYYVDLFWTPSDDPNFKSYEIYYERDGRVSLNSERISAAIIPRLASQRTVNARLELENPGLELEIMIRATDLWGNVSDPSNVLVTTLIDTLQPEIMFTNNVVQYPADIWPPLFECVVKSNQSLNRVDLIMEFNDGHQSTINLLPETNWNPTTLITYSNSNTPDSEPVSAGEVINYYYEIEDYSEQHHIVRYPETENLSMTVTEGEDILLADLESDNGGFTSNLDPSWTYGPVLSGPENGYDGENGWSMLELLPNSQSALNFPEQMSYVGNEYLYLVFQQWYNTEVTANNDERVYVGGRMEYSTNGGNTWLILNPLQGYDYHYIDYQSEEAPCFGGDSEGWQRSIFKLAPLIDDITPMLRFVIYSNNSTNSAGWVIDNVIISAVAPKLEPVQDIKISMLTNGNAQLRWDRNGADYYKIYTAETPYSSMSHIANVTGNVWNIVDVVDDDFLKRYFRVTAVLR